MSGTKRKLDDAAEPLAKEAKLEDTESLAVSDMPRTQEIADDTVVVVTQLGTDWHPMPIQMKHLRATKSSFLDEAIEGGKLVLPVGTCATQDVFLFLFGRYLPSGGAYWTGPLGMDERVALVSALDALGCDAYTKAELTSLGHSGQIQPHQMFEMGRRYHHTELVKNAATEYAEHPGGEKPQEHMLPILAPIWLDIAQRLWIEKTAHDKQIETIIDHIQKLRDHWKDPNECDNDDCPKNCDGTLVDHPDHPAPFWKETADGEYEGGGDIIDTVNKIADVLGMDK